MSKRHQITLFSMIKDESERKFIPELERYCKKVQVFKRAKSPWTLRNILFAQLGPYPLVVIRNRSSVEKRAVEEELRKEKYDLIHAEAFYVMPHIPNTLVPTILVEQTIEYMVYKHYVDNEVSPLLKPFYMLDVLKCRFWEKYFWRKTDRLVAVSKEDRKVMQRLVSGIKVDIIPNGVDFDYFNAKSVSRFDPPRVLYGVTNFEWLQNREAVDVLVKNIWPGVIKKMKDVKLWIVGRKIPKELVALSKLRNDIEVTESIEDARDAYLASSVMVTPIRGSGGTRLKILEAMAAGLPVVSTTMGVAGLELTNGKEVIVSDNTQGLIAATIDLLQNKTKATRIGVNGQRFVKKYFDWQVIVGLHEPIYKEVMNG